ncbi:ATP-binding protein [Uliginosibacterium sp. 31-16]|uniref:ATP-binding protein n=1 Tax=Uliginosibacterium sp. 31-16 TaxID=3068315 RepID=UPI00273E03A9|nr:ATP-binding protein [Uliginosibacterium sp. 31-16]MDP5240400.1 ATP-binding protein [Uliginosibacterium sp. 31-16]
MIKNLEPLHWQSFLLLDLVDVGILVIDAESVLFANTKFSRIVGMNLRELQARSLRELGGDAWIDFTLGQSWADALPWPMKDGSDRWFEVSMQPTDFEGRTVQIATCTDVTSRMRAEGAEASMLQLLTEIIEGYPVGTFVLDKDHCVTHWNRACEVITGIPANHLIGSDDAGSALGAGKGQLLADWVMNPVDEDGLRQKFNGRLWKSPATDGAFEAELYVAEHGNIPARWMHVAATPLRDAGGEIIGAIETLIDITDRKAAEKELRNAREAAEQLVTERTRELREAKTALEFDITRRKQIEGEMQQHLMEVTALNAQLHETQDRLVQSQQQLVQNEKLASIGQLAAGVAHEINNPIGYVFSNFGSLQTYLADLLRLIDAYVQAEPDICNDSLRAELATLRQSIDLDYLKTDLLDLMRESREGIERVRKIVQDLKDFSHVDASADWQWVDLHRGLESTLNVVNNEIKYKADVVREFSVLPQIQCLPSQLNQVFMNLLVNAAHAIKPEARGTIRVRTGAENEHVWIEISDNGCGMSPEVMSRIFDPFFTTKPVGKGTGLGLSLSYGIVHKHHGKIEVCSTPGEGTTFRITLPVCQPETAPEEASPS